MGEVFEARRTGPGGFRRAVALKRLVGDDAVRGVSVQRFLAEARILASLHHPNVLEIHDVVAADSGYVLVMELLTGVTLDALVRAAAAAGGLPVDELCAIADQALAGLEYIHAARGEDGRPLGLIHRDVTPNNVFVTELGEVKLIDFGIAKLRAAGDAPVTREGEIHGTLELIAPEQARGLPGDPRTDLYLLAATLYWALGGRYPHGAGTTLELMARAASVQPPRLAELRHDLPAELTAAIDRAMAIDPDARFADAAALRAALVPWVLVDRQARIAARVRAMPDRADDGADRANDGADVERIAPSVSGEPPADRPDHDVPETLPARAGARRDGERAGVLALAKRRGRRWPAVVAGSAVVIAAALWFGRSMLTRATTGRAGADGPFTLDAVDVPGARGAIAAVPLPGDRVAYATASEVRIVSLRGDALHTIALGPNLAIAPLDITALSDGSLVIAGQDARGARKIYFLHGDTGSSRWDAQVGEIIALDPDGSVAAVARRGAPVTLKSASDNPRYPRPIVPITAERELVAALAWSADGKQLAAIIDRGVDPPSIAIVGVAADGTTTTRSELPHAAFHGDIAMLGWLDADHLIYVVNQPAGAALYRFSLHAQTEQLMKQWQGERALGGHIAEHTIALLHGPVRHRLWLGTPQGVTELPAGDATSLAGFDPRGRVVLGTTGGPIARTQAGEQTAWPGGNPGDRPEALAGGALLAARDGALYQIDPSPRKLVGMLAPRGLATVRCAGDAAPPCVVPSWSEGMPRYRVLDTTTGKIVMDSIISFGVGFDHAVSRDGKKLAVVDGTDRIYLSGVVRLGDDGYKPSTQIDDAALDAVAWSGEELGEELIVSARGWKQKPWALLAVAAARLPSRAASGAPAPAIAEPSPRLIAEAPDCVAAEIRASETAIAVLTTHVTPTLSVLQIR